MLVQTGDHLTIRSLPASKSQLAINMSVNGRVATAHGPSGPRMTSITAGCRMYL